MDKTELLDAYSSLPPEAQQVVASLIVLLRRQSQSAKRNQKPKATHIADEQFVGLWKDRDELQDSNAYLRDLRRNEWM